jgi:plastocyanin
MLSRSLLRHLAAFAVPALLIGAVACSSNNNSNNSSNSGASSGAAVTPVPQVGGTPGAAPAIVQVATDNKYSVTKMAVPAGKPVTVIVQNKGAIHNWHLQNVKDASGKDIATPLQQGPTTFSVTFTVSQPGTYNFICDAHPADMKGTLVAQ